MSGTPTLPAQQAAMVAAFNSLTGMRWQGDAVYQEALWAKAWTAALASGATQPSEPQIEEAQELVSFYRKAVIEALGGGAEEISTMQTEQRRLVAALAATAEPTESEPPELLLRDLRAHFVELRSALGHPDNIAIAELGINSIDSALASLPPHPTKETP